VLVPDVIKGKPYVDIVLKLQNLAKELGPVAAVNYKTVDFDIQPVHSDTNIYKIAQEEGRKLWSKGPPKKQ
jgi:hypothetical protein